MTNMKKITLLFIASALIISCGKETEKPSLEELNAQKTILGAKIDSLNAVLKSVEAEISKLDSGKTFKQLQFFLSKMIFSNTFLKFKALRKPIKTLK